MELINRTDYRWHLGGALGALCVSASAVLLGLAAATPATATAARCLFALPVVGALAWQERRRHGALSMSGYLTGVGCGVLFAGDMLWWTQSIPEVGAGLSTVLVNTQIALVPLLAWLVDRERVGPRFLWSLPVILAGVLLAGGAFQRGAVGSNPVWGTVHAIAAALCYSGFLFLLRRGGQAGQPMQTYGTVLVSAAIIAIATGPCWHGVDFTPPWSSIGWLVLVTLTGQLLGWLLVAFCSPRLPSDVSSALLLLTPVGAVVLGALVLRERPTTLQLTGCAIVLAASYVATSRPRQSRTCGTRGTAIGSERAPVDERGGVNASTETQEGDTL